VNAVCAVCGVTVDGVDALAEHLVLEAGESDVAHVMWLNRNVTKHRVTAADLAILLRQETSDPNVAGPDGGEDRVNR
jgi:hypothetical protein